MKYNHLIIAMFCLVQFGIAQNKYERESRIKVEEFPDKSYTVIQDYLEDAKRVRFYQETDSVKKSFEAKFKKGRLHYSVEFDQNGILEDVEFQIKERDIPNDTWDTILYYLDKNHTKYRVKRIQQQYPVLENQSIEQTLHNAFQNLILPEVNYELVFVAKENKAYQEYEALFNADGQLIQLRKSYPSGYDYLLY